MYTEAELVAILREIARRQHEEMVQQAIQAANLLAEFIRDGLQKLAEIAEEYAEDPEEKERPHHTYDFLAQPPTSVYPHLIQWYTSGFQ